MSDGYKSPAYIQKIADDCSAYVMHKDNEFGEKMMPMPTQKMCDLVDQDFRTSTNLPNSTGFSENGSFISGG